MKKRIFAILLALTLALSLLPTAVFATGEDGAAAAEDVEAAQPANEEQPESGTPDANKPEEPAVQSVQQGIALLADEHKHCFCGGSVTAGDHTSHEDVTYKKCRTWNELKSPWVGKDSVAYVYLENDITADKADESDPYLSIMLGRTLYLCLNGHKLDLGDNYIWVGQKGATLYLCDCSTQKTGTVSGGSRGCISVDDNIDYNATFNMYGGTLKGGNRTGTGGGVDVVNGTMNLYGGTITENTATSDGGGIYVNSKGALNLYGGTITKNTVSTNEGHHGGGVYVESNESNGVGKISISGSPVITGNTRTYTPDSTTTTENLYLSYGFYNSGKFPTITLGTLTSGANIGISTGFCVFSTASETDYSGYFSSDDTGRHVEYNGDKKLELKTGAGHVHSGGTATCTKRAICESCGKEYGEINAKNHTGTLGSWQSDGDNHWKVYSCCNAIISKAAHHGGTATCTDKAVCLVCGSSYGNIDPDNHVWRAWTSNGNDTHTRTCWNNENHTETNNCSGGTATCTVKAVCDFCKQAYGALKAHDFTAEKAEAKYLKSGSSCTAEAVYYKSCTVCGLSSEGTASEATFTSGSVLGHDWGEPSYTWREVPDGYMCVASSKCKNCTEDVSDIATVSYAVTKAPTCLNDGIGTYTATFSAAYGFPAATKDVTLSALGHKWGEATYSWVKNETGGYRCTAKRICENDSTHIETADAAVTYRVVTPATCIDDGSGTYSATFTAVWAAAQTKDEAIPALGHDWADATCTTPKTCKICKVTEGNALGHKGGTANCHTKAVCEVCKEKYGEFDGANHDGGTEIKNAKDATCTEKGYTGDTYCKGCNAKLTDGKDIPALGHDWADATCTTPKTCKVCKVTEGTALGHSGGTADCCHKAKCEVCKQEYGEFDPDNHSDLKHFPYKRPTTRAEGNIEYWYCSGCGKYYKDAEATREITQKDTVIRKRRSTFGSSADDDKTVKSVKTGDAGIALYVGMAALSLTGGAWLRRKKQ